MTAYEKHTDDIIKLLESDRQSGLKLEQTQERLLKHGQNLLQDKKKKSMLQRFLDQFKDVMILILIVAALISFGIAIYENKAHEFFEPALILLIVFLNALVGMMQENKAERALDALKSLSAPHARVIRDGKEQIIDAAFLVPGDIILLEAGDYVPADARLISAFSLKSEEAALTGESLPSEKNAGALVKEKAPIGDRINMVYSGCSITYGTATAIVVATGMDTEMGKVAGLLSAENDMRTPLQDKLARLGKYLGIAALLACAVIFVIGVLDGMPIMEIFMVAVSLAVSAIPEGLPAIVTVVLSLGVQRMVKKNALIRRLPAVETLGSASVICSDKTGTLTQNRMTLQKAFCDGQIGLEEISSQNSATVKELLQYASLCCDGSILVTDDGVQHIGDPTETSILYAAYKNGMEKDALLASFPRVASLPFDSDRKLMTSVNEMGGALTVIVKGAFDVLEKRCIRGNVERARQWNDTMSASALRVIAVAYKKVEKLPASITAEELENELVFLGLMGMIDPPRPEAQEAVRICRKAGIRPVMITGDHVITACAIAKELGIYQEGDRAITGVELDAMNDECLDKTVRSISVYARVSPENKIRIVKAWQKQGEIVAMTGDGVNDAPALKAADIGCAMGITGTDVAKGASDMTLTDDNFATIVDAVREGRAIYANIKKVVGFLLGTNIGELIAVFFAMLLYRETPLLSMQLLMINLVTDSMPAIALGMEKADSDIMERKPKPREEGIFANGLAIRVVLQGLLFAVLTLVGFHIGKNYAGIDAGRTMAFMVLALTQVVQSFNMRSDLSLFHIGFFTNASLNLAALFSTALVAITLFTPLHIPFGLVPLPLSMYLYGLGLAFAPLIVMEAVKALLTKKS